MFTQPVSSPPTVGPVPTSVTNPASPSPRSSRLRGLSYLRSYTQNHILSREHSSSQGSSSPTSNSHSHSHFHHNTGASPHPHSQTPTQTQTQNHANRSIAASARPTHSLQRSLSYTPTSSTLRRSDTDPSLNPLSLVVASLQEPHSSSSSANKASTTPSSPAVERPLVDALPSILDDAIASSSSQASQQHQTQTPDTEAAAAAAAAAAIMTRARSSTTGDAQAAAAAPAPAENMPSIRFSAYYDPRATRPSLTFPPVSRTLPSGGDVIRVGRYSERDNQPNVPNNTPSAAPVGFKSKVVSRRHCEFWYDDGKWYIKDVKSSSGTFLNHIRLSPPGTESKPFPVNDGDIVQLGIDFKGGEEMIFRCVKMRLELNRGWQNKLNTFNMATHKRLRNMTAANSANSSTQDCSICLNSIAPCQCLFVAPCSHTWHFKCIRSLLNSPQYPIFVCPNCRMAADLEADIEDPEEDWEGMDEDEDEGPEQKQQKQEVKDMPAVVSEPIPAPVVIGGSGPQLPEIDHDGDVIDFTAALERSHTMAEAPETAPQTVAPNTSMPPVPIPAVAAVAAAQAAASRNGRDTRTPSPIANHLLTTHEGPITPRNDAGPWVFDGSAGRRAAEASTGMRSLDAATEMEVDR
ncbi:FHA domain-containing protein [Colletotrichum graminicola]|uniref:RING-type E3 ubiquitin transferase n=1 Tax=Colletotrichum graminicola (strain M1.001 / M2 / FGSC 10212) TaxID=645133 RepID=E3Q254_COLGM|nr:FHA domain-containing protein [Colletotrichum graminicola M1.001]EFQ25155.1 FHA domain-containing protein [Colletotrichum graminicola M1.001]WDK15226.1 FHA domain-containing protein [Colletotrichum graminicola]